MTDLIDHYIIITKESDKWINHFNKKLIFNTLTDEHLLKLFTLQKIKYFTCRKSMINIYIDDFELEEFKLNPKLYTLLKYHNDKYGVNLFYINNPSELSDEELNNLNILNNNEKLNNL